MWSHVIHGLTSSCLLSLTFVRNYLSLLLLRFQSSLLTFAQKLTTFVVNAIGLQSSRRHMMCRHLMLYSSNMCMALTWIPNQLNRPSISSIPFRRSRPLYLASLLRVYPLARLPHRPTMTSPNRPNRQIMMLLILLIKYKFCSLIQLLIKWFVMMIHCNLLKIILDTSLALNLIYPLGYSRLSLGFDEDCLRRGLLLLIFFRVSMVIGGAVFEANGLGWLSWLNGVMAVVRRNWSYCLILRGISGMFTNVVISNFGSYSCIYWIKMLSLARCILVGFWARINFVWLLLT